MREEFKSYCHEGVHPDIVINNDDTMSVADSLRVLKAIRRTIILGTQMYAVDSNVTGDKYLDCNWGTCSCNPEHFPKPEMHIFPQDFVDRKRVAPLELVVGCPMRKCNKNDGWSIRESGCFWQCRIFKGKHKVTKEQALSLYDKAITKLEAQQ